MEKGKIGWLAIAIAMVVACGGKTLEIPNPTTTTEPDPPIDPIIDPTPPTLPTNNLPKPPAPPSKPPKALPPTIPQDPPPNPCQARPFYLDADGDGFGDDKTIVIGCTAPKGYVTLGGDCFDKNADAFPGQVKFFSKDRGDGSFDYDCDSDPLIEVETKEPTYCLCSGAYCSTSGGWVKTVPGCGEAGDWNTSTTGCQFTPEKRIQSCH